jgi:segregation and condensation protein B
MADGHAPKPSHDPSPAPAVPDGLDLAAFQRPPTDQGLSLADLSQAFAQMLTGGLDPYQEPPNEGRANPGSEAWTNESEVGEPTELTPRGILEAMLFVGAADRQPLTGQRVAGMMRGVRAAEIDELVKEINAQYDANGCPYRIASEGEGYRLALTPSYERIRERFQGKGRQARLSPAAIEVLSIVAYNGPQTAEAVARLRGRPSGPLLSQLVRRQLLRIEREPGPPSIVRYETTQRFLDLFGMASLGDLPRSEDLDRA